MIESQTQSTRTQPRLTGSWRLDLRRWRVEWSSKARAIHAMPDGPDPTIWEALEFVDPADRPLLVERMLACVRDDEPFTVKVGLTTVSGMQKRVELAGFPSTLPGGSRTVAGTIGVLREHVAPAGHRQDMVASLRTWEMLGDAIPHELLGPLAAMEGFATALADGEAAVSERGRARLGRVVAASRHMRSVLEGLLLFAPVCTKAVRVEPVDLSAIASECVQLLRDSDPARVVSVHIQPGLQDMADPDMMRLVLANLLGNAWKFTRHSASARIVFERHRHDDGEAYAVRDNGAGFDMADMPKLFTPFQRLHPRESFDGTGVGLSIVRRAIERQGGSVWARSAPGEGASFMFELRPRSGNDWSSRF
jgi:signal transduction histidine kinase